MGRHAEVVFISGVMLMLLLLGVPRRSVRIEVAAVLIATVTGAGITFWSLTQ